MISVRTTVEVLDARISVNTSSWLELAHTGIITAREVETGRDWNQLAAIDRTNSFFLLNE